jgi:hypothetical protein
MKTKYFFFGLLVTVMTVVMGCHMINIKSNDDQYLTAKNSQPLVVPQGATGEKLVNDFPITGNRYPKTRYPVSQVPPK